jgi:hypothetical protein
MAMDEDSGALAAGLLEVQSFLRMARARALAMKSAVRESSEVSMALDRIEKRIVALCAEIDALRQTASDRDR